MTLDYFMKKLSAITGNQASSPKICTVTGITMKNNIKWKNLFFSKLEALKKQNYYRGSKRKTKTPNNTGEWVNYRLV